MAFIPSNNILDKDTHNILVKSFVNGGIGYTEDDGTVHKISGDYVESGSSLPDVSADDNGDVLTVVEGEWAKATPSGGGGNTLIINVLYNEQYMMGYLDKNFTEIRTALASGIVPLVVEENPEADPETAYYYDYVLYTEIDEGTYKVDIGVQSSSSFISDSATGVLHRGE